MRIFSSAGKFLRLACLVRRIYCLMNLIAKPGQMAVTFPADQPRKRSCPELT
jgi:hypothetical protein